MQQIKKNEATVFETIEKSDLVKKQPNFRRDKAGIHLLSSYDFYESGLFHKINSKYEELLDSILYGLWEKHEYWVHIEDADCGIELSLIYNSIGEIYNSFTSMAEAKEYAINYFYQRFNNSLNDLDS